MLKPPTKEGLLKLIQVLLQDSGEVHSARFISDLEGKHEICVFLDDGRRFTVWATREGD